MPQVKISSTITAPAEQIAHLDADSVTTGKGVAQGVARKTRARVNLLRPSYIVFASTSAWRALIRITRPRTQNPA